MDHSGQRLSRTAALGRLASDELPRAGLFLRIVSAGHAFVAAAGKSLYQAVEYGGGCHGGELLRVAGVGYAGFRRL